jgi:hypothetical protein
MQLREKDRFLNASSPIFEATEFNYEAIDERINELVSKPNTIVNILY